ncbi:MAG: lyase family protein [Ancalomicrobiaceae bacterium]|nr:lyase family protein [Ancalomicrobiaceae bacterium]
MPIPALATLYRDLFSDDETSALFSGEAEVAAMLAVEAALAEAQGRLGVIPAEAAAVIADLAHNAEIAPEDLAAEAGRHGVPVPGLIAALRERAAGSDAAQYLHWGATSQDIVDTGLSLRLKRLVVIWDGRLAALTATLAHLARAHAELPMAGRTYGQAATPTSFGALVAAWGRPLVAYRRRLQALKPDILRVSLSGAAGTLSAMGPRGADVRAALAEALGLIDPGSSWHAERDGFVSLMQWMAGVTASLAKMGEDISLLMQTGIGEVSLATAGGSSTMPQKSNPVGPSVIVALARHVAGFASVSPAAAIHRLQRDGAAWFSEWLTLPATAESTGRALVLANEVATGLAPNAEAMRRGLDAGYGTIFAEALTFALAETMPRPEAAAVVGALCKRAVVEARPLIDLVAEVFPGRDWSAVLSGGALLGQAPVEARAFADAVEA